MPAMMPARSCSPPRVAETLRHLGDLERQRQRAVLQHVGQLGRGLLGEVAADLGPGRREWPALTDGAEIDPPSRTMANRFCGSGPGGQLSGGAPRRPRRLRVELQVDDPVDLVLRYARGGRGELIALDQGRRRAGISRSRSGHRRPGVGRHVGNFGPDRRCRWRSRSDRARSAASLMAWSAACLCRAAVGRGWRRREARRQLRPPVGGRRSDWHPATGAAPPRVRSGLGRARPGAVPVVGTRLVTGGVTVSAA